MWHLEMHSYTVCIEADSSFSSTELQLEVRNTMQAVICPVLFTVISYGQ